MILRTARRRVRLACCTLAGDRRGIAATEFALILPALLLLCFGSTEVTQAIALDRTVSLAAGTVSNLVAQYSTISISQQMPDILAASTQVLAPNPASKAKVVVTCINIDNSGTATVAWSQTLNGTAKKAGAAITVPAALKVANTNVIFSEVTYTYTPILDFLKIGNLNLYSSVYMYPRASTTINLVA
ncbi:MAG TPA: TadE/TadG family type IV pilus assembly protein [Caulobacteraceae bacterium]|jgi:Flp pilus assembly protein TadG|nr:TadE/TadG family type IV pilus assembly protein [Caulobacteraceae bacterium]